MGTMNLAPLFGQFQFYFPILCIVIVFLLGFNVIERIGNMCGFADILFSEDENNAGAWGDVEDGRLLLADSTSVFYIYEKQNRGFF
jgi:hypothetical protein